MRIIACSSSNRNSASARASSVLPTPVGPEEQEAADRAVRILEARARAAHGRGDRVDRVVLTDDALRAAGPPSWSSRSDLALEHLLDGDAGPLRDHRRDVVLGDLLAEEAALRAQLVDLGGLLGELAARAAGIEPNRSSDARAKSPVRCRRSASALSCSSFSFFVAQALDHVALVLPRAFMPRRLLLELGDLALDLGQPLLASACRSRARARRARPRAS